VSPAASSSLYHSHRVRQPSSRSSIRAMRRTSSESDMVRVGMRRARARCDDSLRGAGRSTRTRGATTFAPRRARDASCRSYPHVKSIAGVSGSALSPHASFGASQWFARRDAQSLSDR
jgi:ribosomal protein L4